MRRLPSHGQASTATPSARPGDVRPYPTIVVRAPSDLLERARRSEHGWLNIRRRTFEEHESGVGNAWLEWRDQDVVGRIALRRRRAMRHRRVRGLSDHRNPRAGIPRIRWTEAREHANRGWQLTQRLGWRGEVTGRKHDVRANQRAACERPQLDRLSGIIDAPNHDHADIRISVLSVDGRLSRRCYRSRSTAIAPVMTAATDRFAMFIGCAPTDGHAYQSDIFRISRTLPHDPNRVDLCSCLN